MLSGLSLVASAARDQSARGAVFSRALCASAAFPSDADSPGRARELRRNTGLWESRPQRWLLRCIWPLIAGSLSLHLFPRIHREEWFALQGTTSQAPWAKTWHASCNGAA